MKTIAQVINSLNKDYAEIAPPATSKDIDRINALMQREGMNSLPSGIEYFNKITSHLQYNGMIIYGTHSDLIVKYNIDKRDYYHEFQHLLFFGSIDDDIFTYNYLSHKYEARDINGMECWDVYDNFEDMFKYEIAKWLI